MKNGDIVRYQGPDCDFEHGAEFAVRAVSANGWVKVVRRLGERLQYGIIRRELLAKVGSERRKARGEKFNFGPTS